MFGTTAALFEVTKSGHRIKYRRRHESCWRKTPKIQSPEHLARVLGELGEQGFLCLSEPDDAYAYFLSSLTYDN